MLAAGCLRGCEKKKTYCAARLRHCAVLGILMYSVYTPVPALRAPYTRAARDGFSTIAQEIAVGLLNGRREARVPGTAGSEWSGDRWRSALSEPVLVLADYFAGGGAGSWCCPGIPVPRPSS